MSLFLIFPPIRKAIESNVGTTFGRIFRNMKAGNYQGAYEVALKKLKEEKFHKNEGITDHFSWWNIMGYACENLAQFDSAEKRKELTDLIIQGPEPFQGYDVSKSLCYAALWKLELNQNVQALELAQRARDSDPTYYYAWYLLGGISLSLNRVDAQSYFLKAIELDALTWSYIKEDPMCLPEKEMLRSLKEQALTKGIALKD